MTFNDSPRHCGVVPQTGLGGTCTANGGTTSDSPRSVTTALIGLPASIQGALLPGKAPLP